MVKTNRSAALRLRLVLTEHQEGMGRRIRARRDELALSRDEVARRMGAIAAAGGGGEDKTNGNAIYRYEMGEVTPGPKKLDLLAAALETTVAAFMMDPPTAEETPDFMGQLAESSNDEVVSTLKQLVDRIETLEQTLAEFGEALEARLPVAAPRQRRASGN